MADTVLLTGVSGFLGGHVALALLNAGYQVRGSLRSLGKADHVRTTLAKAGADVSRLEFVALNLLGDQGWEAAAQGCRYLVHTASPVAARMPTDKMELIRPAVEGTERALNAGLKAKVERVVLTSSMAAIAAGHDLARTTPFTAADWTNLNGRPVSAYVESKTRAERRAWELMKAAGRESDLAVINPAYIFGPLLDEDPGTSVGLIARLLKGGIPAAPRMILSIVDVRDVAAAHAAALSGANAGGRRFPMGEGSFSLMQIGDILRRRVPERADKMPRRELPDWFVRVLALFDRSLRNITGELGVIRRLDSSDAIALLGRKLIAPEEALVASAQSLIAQGLA
ncbi:MAG: NAD-dependent epimerase/dehydratase family protein [Bradyrhizobium sp.]|nr:MAG: NAD-dependent epimerase/dehydratase family protein [Bradyrhizobium sp.]